jgi:hypothetical protein
MKIRHFNLVQFQAFPHHSTLQIGLRHGKIIINTLLRRCSAGLLSSYLLTFAVSIHFVNWMTFTSSWATDMIVLLLVLMFVSLLFIQDRYSEKRHANDLVSRREAPVNTFAIRSCYQINKRLLVIFLSANVSGWLLLTVIPLPAQPALTALFVVMATSLYAAGLMLLRRLLKEKSAIGQMTGTSPRAGNHK